MATAHIKINGAGNDVALLTAAINTSLTLSYATDATVVTTLWGLTAQPTGTSDTAQMLTPTAATTAFTPRKEGTYRFKLTLNAAGTPVIAYIIVGVQQLKTLARVPAFQEALEASTVAPNAGWWTAMESQLLLLDRVASDPGVIVANAAPASTAAGKIVVLDDYETIKTGLAGQENVPEFSVAQATSAVTMQKQLGYLLGDIDGTTPVLINHLAKVRLFGLATAVIGDTSGQAVGSLLYCSDAGIAAITTGTNKRVIGRFYGYTAPTTYFWFDGTGQEVLEILAPNAGPNKIYIDAAVAAGQLLVPVTLAGPVTHTLVVTDLWLIVDATAGDVTVNLPAPVAGWSFYIKRLDAAAHVVTIHRAAAEKIEFVAADYVIPVTIGASARFACNGTDWFIVG